MGCSEGGLMNNFFPLFFSILLPKIFAIPMYDFYKQEKKFLYH